jgi:nicotinate-nucleotide adenylyltransferase
MKTGILGGTFDPVHLGHLEIAAAVEDSLGLDEVVFIPAGRSPFKTRHKLTPAGERLEMLRLALEGKPRYRASTVEIERPGPSYTVATIAALREASDKEAELYFIMGWDSLAGFPKWREPARIIGMCTLVAVPRPGFKKPDLTRLEKAVPGISKKVVFTDGPLVDISASAIRDVAARGEDIGHLVPRPVADYIREHGLYSGA